MRLHLGGHLGWYDLQKRAWLDLDLAQPESLIELLDQLGVPAGEVALVVVNGQLVELDQARVSDSDRVELYPPIGGGTRSPILKNLPARIAARLANRQRSSRTCWPIRHCSAEFLTRCSTTIR